MEAADGDRRGGATTKRRNGPLRTCAGVDAAARRTAGSGSFAPPLGTWFSIRASAGTGARAYVCPDEPCVDRALDGGLRKMLRNEDPAGHLKRRLLERIPAQRVGRGKDGET